MAGEAQAPRRGLQRRPGLETGTHDAAAQASTLHVITDYSAGQGGAERMLTRYLRQTDFAKGRIVSLKGAAPQLYAESGSQANEVTALEARGPFGFAAGVVRLARLIAREQPAAVVCWMYHAHLAGTLAALVGGYRGPVIWNVRTSLDEPAALAPGTRLAIFLARMFRWRCDGTIFNSRRSCEQHVGIGYGRNPGVISNGVEPVASLPPPAWPPRRIGIVARFHPHKDYPTFLRAAARILADRPDATIVAAGAGVSLDNSAFAEAVRAAGLPADRLELHDELQDLSALYESLDLMVLSSRIEAFPNVLIEAMSRGVPCVTTDVGDAAEIVQGSGCVVAPRDANALAEAILRMLRLSRDEYLHRRAAAAEKVSSQYSIGAAAREYARFIRACVEMRAA
ncbi:glycosyltransferase [Sphingosinicella sp. BN140058]|uniref:glycosyltransferase n=1 Tax=Sphingosinicella sp. BN140058 TaxID=1892855 RepID=UPI0013EAEFA0|nr:glycosyltransferase [Sphingosinicella sp. BN140058]